jgi:hypothetical protein
VTTPVFKAKHSRAAMISPSTYSRQGMHGKGREAELVLVKAVRHAAAKDGLGPSLLSLSVNSAGFAEPETWKWGC